MKTNLKAFLSENPSGIAVHLKQSLDNVEQLNQIIEAVSCGKVVLDPAVTNHIVTTKTGTDFLKNITDRELEILSLLARGYTNYSIAEAFSIDVRTVEHHLNSIYSKLKENVDSDQKHPWVSIARLYLETTGELLPTNTK
jgi:DNA-binding NarL/FixJ family response regulator